MERERRQIAQPFRQIDRRTLRSWSGSKTILAIALGLSSGLIYSPGQLRADQKEATGSQADSAPPSDGKAKQSWILDHRNWQRAEQLLPAAVVSRVKSGEYSLEVIDTDSEQLARSYSTPFLEASAANAGKYEIDAATCGLKEVATQKIPDAYFGYPFPQIDAADPQAACKVAWNVEAVNAMGEGQETVCTLTGVDPSGEYKRIRFSRHDISYQGRQVPIENSQGLRSASFVNLVEPQEIDGVAGLFQRINDWTSQDKVWFFVPSTRRVRRVNAATVSVPIAGLDAFRDDINCFGGKIEHNRWKFIGRGTVLAPFVEPASLLRTQSATRFEVTIPAMRAGYEIPGKSGAPWWIGSGLQFTPRPVWIIAAESADPYHSFGKVILYVDKDLYRIYWRVVHNRAGDYFYNAMCAYQTSRTDDGMFSAVTQVLTLGVNDRVNRASLIRPTSSFIERHVEERPYGITGVPMRE